MDIARGLALDGAHPGTTVVARAQKSGRGRKGRSWFSPDGAGLWLTSLLHSQKPPEQISQLGIVAGIATLRALEAMGFGGAQLKWPNDIMVSEQKLAGILLEAHNLQGETPQILIGVGLNLAPNTELDLPPDVAQRYIGLAQLSNATESSNLYEEALTKLVQALQSNSQIWEEQGLTPLLPFWRKHDWLVGHQVQALSNAGPIAGIARGITVEGALEIETTSGLFTVRSGEIQRIRTIRP